MTESSTSTGSSSPRQRSTTAQPQGELALVARLSVVPFFGATGLAGAVLLRALPGIPQIGFSIFLFGLYVVLYRAMFAKRSLLDVGTFFLFTVLAYQIFPLISLELSDYNLGIFGDNRLHSISLTSSFLSEVWSIQTLIMTGFGTAYLLFKRVVPAKRPLVSDAQQWLFGAVLAASLAIVVGTSLVLGGDSYLDEYLITQDLPLIAIQALNVINQMFFAAMFGFLIISIRTAPAATILVALAACLLLAVSTGARTPIAIIVFAAFVVYDGNRKRINPALLATFATVLLTVFLVAGVLRGSGYMTDLVGQNEFMSIFVTTLDVYQIAITGAARDMATELWVSDLLRPIPGQLLPFEKFDAALWYMNNFYPLQAAAGQAYGFSMASEAVLSGGAATAIARSVLLGLLVALVAGRLEGSRSIYAKIGGVWLFCFIYLSYRDATFTLVPRFLFQFGPALLVIFLIDRFFMPRPAEQPGSAGVDLH